MVLTKFHIISCMHIFAENSEMLNGGTNLSGSGTLIRDAVWDEVQTAPRLYVLKCING